MNEFSSNLNELFVFVVYRCNGVIKGFPACFQFSGIRVDNFFPLRCSIASDPSSVF